MLTRLALLAAAIFGVKYLVNAARTAKTASQLTFTILGIERRTFKISLSGIKFGISLKYTNPSPNPITVDYIFLDVIINGNTLAHVEEKSPFTVPAQSNASQVVTVNIYLTEALPSLRQLASDYLTTGKLPEKYNIRGYIQANGIQVPINKEANLI